MEIYGLCHYYKLITQVKITHFYVFFLSIYFAAQIGGDSLKKVFLPEVETFLIAFMAISTAFIRPALRKPEKDFSCSAQTLAAKRFYKNRFISILLQE